MANRNYVNDVLAQNEEYGFVYILTNKWMPNIVKIGKTGNILERMRVLYATNVPEAFTAVHVSKVRMEKMDDTEKALHAVFSEGRVNPKREFFLWDDDKADKAEKVLKLVEVQDVTNDVNGEVRSNLPADEAAAMDNSEELIRRARRPNLDFHLLGINDGERLYWKDNDRIFVTVCSERKVEFNCKQCYLTTATKEILGTTAPTAPAPYWLYNGKILKDIYDSFYELPPSGEIQSAASDKISHSRVCYTNFAAKVIIFFVNLSPTAQILLLYGRFCLSIESTSKCKWLQSYE